MSFCWDVGSPFVFAMKVRTVVRNIQLSGESYVSIVGEKNLHSHFYEAARLLEQHVAAVLSNEIETLIIKLL